MGIFKRGNNKPGTDLPPDPSAGPTNGPYDGNKYLYSYSGADAKPFCWFDEAPELATNLVSLHTISVSVHEAKGQARALGYRGIKGLAKGIRTIAGSMILTVVNDHPLYPLIAQYNTMVGLRKNSLYDLNAQDIESLYNRGEEGWSVDRNMTGVGTIDGRTYDNRLCTLLPGFNLAMVYVTEQGRAFNANGAPESAGWLLSGVEFITEGMVTSVNDIVTEMTFQFIACDFKPLSYRAWAGTAEQIGTVANDLTSQEFTQNYEKERALRDRLRGQSTYTADDSKPVPSVGSPNYSTEFGSKFPSDYDYKRGG